MKHKQYTEEDTFNALRRAPLSKVKEDIKEALGISFSRLSESTLREILKNNNWKVSEYMKAINGR